MRNKISNEERQTVTHEDTKVDNDLQRRGERNHRESAGGRMDWKEGRCYPLNENPNRI